MLLDTHLREEQRNFLEMILTAAQQVQTAARRTVASSVCGGSSGGEIRLHNKPSDLHRQVRGGDGRLIGVRVVGVVGVSEVWQADGACEIMALLRVPASRP